ncbi:MAG: hypothetical protein IJ864_02695, partial [Alphaproteobacteria bacterium]|nr:hypothetical protein [Alphaproteobacteria bacterium]
MYPVVVFLISALVATPAAADLYDALQEAGSSAYTYTMTGDETATKDYGSPYNKRFTLNGEGYTLYGMGYNGFEFQSSTLAVNNVTFDGFSKAFRVPYSGGSNMTLNDVTFQNNDYGFYALGAEGLYITLNNVKFANNGMDMRNVGQSVTFTGESELTTLNYGVDADGSEYNRRYGGFTIDTGAKLTLLNAGHLYDENLINKGTLDNISGGEMALRTLKNETGATVINNGVLDVNRDGYNNSEITTTDGQGRFLFTSWPYENGEYYSKNSFDNKGTIAQDSVTVAGDFFNRSDATINTKVLNFGWAYGDGYVLRGSNTSNEDKDQVETTFYHSGVIEGIETLNVEDGIFQNWATISDLREMNLGRNDGTVGQFSNLSSQVLNVDTINVVGKPIGFKYYYESSWGGTSSSWYSFYGKISNSVDATLKANNIHVKTLPYKPPYTYYDRLYVNEISNSGHMEVSDEILLESGYLNQSDGYLKANTLTIAGDEENASYARLYQGTAEINTLVHRKQDEGKLSDLRIYSGSLYLGSAMTLSVTDLQNDGGVDNYSQDVYITHGYNTSSISGDGQLVFTGGANDTFTNSGNISGQSINLGASTFKMTKDGTLDMANGKTFRASGGTFDVLNGAAQDQHLGAVVLDDNLTLLIDADLAEQKADYFSADSLTNDGNHSIIIDAIQILSDTDTLPIKTKVADTVLMSAFKLADSGVRLSNAAGVTGSYAVLYDAIADDGGYLTFDNLRNLVTVSRATEEQRQYNLREDESIAADIAAIGDNSAAIGVMGGGGSTLTVNGKDAEGKTYRIVGDGNGGILVSSGNNLIFNDVKEIREFTTAVTNYYDVVVNNTTFKDNNVDIDNYSSLKFLGDNQVETITGTGQIYVGNDDTTGSLTVAENGSVENGFLYNYAGGVFENKGQTEINYVYNYSSAANGQILNHSSGTFKTRELRNQDGSKFDNRGTVNLDNYYNYTGATTDNSGTFTVSSHTFRNFANFNNAVSGIVNSLYINNEQEGSVINNSGLLNIDSQIFNQSNATINNATSGTINVGMQFYNSHEVNNDGNITTKEFYNYSTVTNNGTVRVNYGNNNGVITSTANDGGKLIVAPGNQYFTNTGTIEKNDVILNGGVLRLSRGVFDMEGQDFTSEGGQLYVQNNAVAQQHLGNVILKKDMKVLIDANLAEQIADNFTAASLSNEDNHNILISSIKVLNDGENKFVKTKVADTVLMNAFKLDDNVTIDNSSGVSGSYAVVYSAIANDGGYLNFDNKNINLVIVSRDTADQRVYVLGDDESIAADIDVIGDASTAIGDMGGTNSTLTINGNGNVADADKYYSVIGDELGGLTVGSGQTLNINNVGRVDDDANVAGGWKNFKISDGGAVIVANNGSVVSVNNTVFTENKAGSVRAEAGAQVALDNVAVVNNASNSGVSNKGELSLTNGLIKGNTFVGTNNSGSYPAVGVYNAGHITNLEADFVDNSMTLTANAQALGGGVMNMSQIDNIKGRFEGNSLETRSNAGTNRWSATGGAIYNYNSAVIGRIEADFVNNEVTNTAGNASVGGGAIYNATGAKIGDIVGNIEGNKILANNNAYGGAIYNSTSATIGDIVGDITNNESHSTNGPARGGVIFNVRAQIGDLKGENGAKASYSGNRAISDTNAADGGVIHNQGQANGVKGIVNSIYADFADNSVQGAGQASGGAVNNNTNTLIREGINGDFTKNYALSTDNLARGGAIIDLGYIENVTGTMDTNYAESHGIGAVGGAIALFKNSSSSDLAAIGLVEGHFVDNYAMATGDDG